MHAYSDTKSKSKTQCLASVFVIICLFNADTYGLFTWRDPSTRTILSFCLHAELSRSGRIKQDENVGL